MTQRAIARAKIWRPSAWPDSSNLSTMWRMVLVALLVAGLYFLSARLATLFAYPNTHTLLLWPPSTVLLVAMLFTPRRTWWAFILASLPAHLFAINPLPATWQVAMLFYAGNVLESIVIALFIQRFVKGGLPRFDHFLGTLTFVVVAAFLAPAIGSLMVAGAAALLGVQPGFWEIWQARFLSYVVAMIMLAPPAISLLASRGAVLRLPATRYFEAGLIALGYVAISLFLYSANPPELRSLAALLFLPLPLLLWADVRFGVGGVSLGLLFTALLSLWAARFGLGPFAEGVNADHVFGLKVLLIELGVPLILMAALLSERRVGMDMLKSRSDEIHRLAGQLITAQEEERRRVVRELHDEIGQSLTTLKINLDTMRMSSTAPDTQALLDEGAALADRALQQVRDLSVLLRPSVLDDLGLEPALRSLLNSWAQRASYAATFHAVGLQTRPPRDIETICFRVAQEGLTNVAKHAHAKHAHAQHVWLDVVAQGEQLRMTLRDDGVGFDIAAKRARAAAGKSMGMLSMAERAALGGGELQWVSAPLQGTTLILTLPLLPAALR